MNWEEMDPVPAPVPDVLSGHRWKQGGSPSHSTPTPNAVQENGRSRAFAFILSALVLFLSLDSLLSSITCAITKRGVIKTGE